MTLNNDIQICKNTFFIHGYCELINPRKNIICNSSKECVSKDGFFKCKNNKCTLKNKNELCNNNNNCLSKKCIKNVCS